jgi:hypothetical protein
VCFHHHHHHRRLCTRFELNRFSLPLPGSTILPPSFPSSTTDTQKCFLNKSPPPIKTKTQRENKNHKHARKPNKCATPTLARPFACAPCLSRSPSPCKPPSPQPRLRATAPPRAAPPRNHCFQTPGQERPCALAGWLARSPPLIRIFSFLCIPHKHPPTPNPYTDTKNSTPCSRVPRERGVNVSHATPS